MSRETKDFLLTGTFLICLAIVLITLILSIATSSRRNNEFMFKSCTALSKTSAEFSTCVHKAR